MIRRNQPSREAGVDDFRAELVSAAFILCISASCADLVSGTRALRNSASACFTWARKASASNVHERRYADSVSPASAARSRNCPYSA